jgi:hypothetical protein
MERAAPLTDRRGRSGSRRSVRSTKAEERIQNRVEGEKWECVTMRHGKKSGVKGPSGRRVRALLCGTRDCRLRCASGLSGLCCPAPCGDLSWRGRASGKTMRGNSGDFKNGGYLGLVHGDVGLAKQEKRLTDFIASFKHALLFTPKVVLADHMVFSPNFERAYYEDAEFRGLLRADLVDIAYFEKYNNGGAFTLVEHRKFREYLRRKQDKAYDPRSRHCPSDPFDEELPNIEASAGRLSPNASWRDWLFTAFACQEVENGTFREMLGRYYEPYVTAFKALKDDLAAQEYPVGIIHVDTHHKVEGTDDVFDYMTRIDTLKHISRARLIQEFGAKIAQAHEVLLIKAEMTLLEGIYAVLPAEFRDFRTLALADSASGTIDEREAQLQVIDVDLSCVTVKALAALSADRVIELRKAAADFFEVMKGDGYAFGTFDIVCRTLKSYLSYLNRAMGLLPVAAQPGRIQTSVQVLQGKVAQHNGALSAGVGMLFKVISSLAHSCFKQHGAPLGSEAIFDGSLKQSEELTKKTLAGPPLQRSIKDLMSQIAISPDGDQVMQYLPPP